MFLAYSAACVGKETPAHVSSLASIVIFAFDAEARQSRSAGSGIEKDIGRLDILVDEATFMKPEGRERPLPGKFELTFQWLKMAEGRSRRRLLQLCCDPRLQ